MFSESESILIRADQKCVYTIAESYPSFATFYKAGEVLAQSDSELTVRIGATLCGLPTTWIGHGKKKRFDSIEFVQTDGLLKGLVALWKFEQLGQSTMVTISYSFTLDIPLVGKILEWAIGTFKVRPTVQMILAALRDRVEVP